MAIHKPRGSNGIKTAFALVFGLAAAFAPQAALAQQARAGVIARPAPVVRAYSRPVPPRPMIPRSLPARPIRGRPIAPRPFRFRHPRPTDPAARTFVPHSFAPPASAQRSLAGPTMYSPEWRGIGLRGYFNPYWLGNPYFFGAGYFGPQNQQMLPLGFGLWPACDSSADPGRFWTIGPCAGIGDYQAVAPSAPIQYPPVPYYYELWPEAFVQQPQTSAPTAAKPAAPQKKPNMVVYLTDGRATAVSDWWVTQGRFFFTTLTGQTESVDLPTLDLRKTIEQNEKQGLTFILNFTPPNERPLLPSLPSAR